MKTIALAFGLLIISSVQAKEIMVLDIPTFTFRESSFESVVYSKFAVNKEPSRAWIEFEIVETLSYSQSPRHYFRNKLEGLSYNDNSKTVTLENEGQLIECAVVKKTRFFHDEVVKPTGNCWFSDRVETVGVDDGYRTGKESRFRVFLNVE